MKSVSLLGSTGSIGTQTLEVIRKNNDIKVLTIGFGTSFISFGLMNLIDCYIGAPKVIITFFILLGILTYIKNNLS